MNGALPGRWTRLPWAAPALAAVVLLPFLNKAHTIDDPIFLRETQNVLIHPHHPSWGLLPWSWGPPDGPEFHVWRVTQ